MKLTRQELSIIACALVDYRNRAEKEGEKHPGTREAKMKLELAMQTQGIIDRIGGEIDGLYGEHITCQERFRTVDSL